MRLTSARLTLAALASIGLADGCRTASTLTPAAPALALAKNVLLVCEHGNVKSLIAASLFNQIASSRGLPFRAQSRGLNPEAGVPAPIKAALGKEGIDVSTFESKAMSHEDAAAASRVISIGVDLTSFATDVRLPIELWSDVPPASVDYASSRAALLLHIEALIRDLQAGRRD